MAETRVGPHGLAFAPTKIGVLIDLDMGTKEDFIACLRFTFDEALQQRVLLRPVELVVKEAIGLPRLEARNAIEGYKWLVEGETQAGDEVLLRSHVEIDEHADLRRCEREPVRADAGLCHGRAATPGGSHLTSGRAGSIRAR